jgi:hypothetical protein
VIFRYIFTKCTISCQHKGMINIKPSLFLSQNFTVLLNRVAVRRVTIFLPILQGDITAFLLCSVLTCRITVNLIPRSEVIRERPIVAQLRLLPPFMDPKRSLIYFWNFFTKMFHSSTDRHYKMSQPSFVQRLLSFLSQVEYSIIPRNI